MKVHFGLVKYLHCNTKLNNNNNEQRNKQLNQHSYLFCTNAISRNNTFTFFFWKSIKYNLLRQNINHRYSPHYQYRERIEHNKAMKKSVFNSRCVHYNLASTQEPFITKNVTLLDLSNQRFGLRSAKKKEVQKNKKIPVTTFLSQNPTVICINKTVLVDLILLFCSRNVHIQPSMVMLCMFRFAHILIHDQHCTYPSTMEATNMKI